MTAAVCIGVAALAAPLLLMARATAVKPLTAVFLPGAACCAVIPAVNTRMLNVASQRARTLALMVQSSAFNLGILVGGRPDRHHRGDGLDVAADGRAGSDAGGRTGDGRDKRHVLLVSFVGGRGSGVLRALAAARPLRH